MAQHKCKSVWQIQENNSNDNNKGLCDRANNVQKVIMSDGTERSVPSIEKLIAKT